MNSLPQRELTPFQTGTFISLKLLRPLMANSGVDAPDLLRIPCPRRVMVTKSVELQNKSYFFSINQYKHASIATDYIESLSFAGRGEGLRKLNVA